MLATQVSGSRYLNEALNTVTQGAGRIAGLGVSLFERGLESQARVAQDERETVLGRERNEITRDAIKQGSLLVQTIVMANAAKRNQQEHKPQRPAPQPARARPTRVVDAELVGHESPTSASNDNSADTSAAPRANKSPLELDIEAKTELFLDLLQHEPLEELRAVAPTLCAFFDRLGRGAADGAQILLLIKEAEQTVERDELMKVHTLVSAELASAFANLMMRAMSES